MNIQQAQAPAGSHVGSFDGVGSADHDQPYVFGRRPTSAVPFPFSTRQYVRLLLMRSRLAEKSLASPKSACAGLPVEIAS
jgi:hypothetical protein